jgi:hypothetical protein
MVVVIEANKASPVWLLQDFEPERDAGTGPYIIDAAKDKWRGLFYGHRDVNPSPRQMAGVKIADRIEHLEEGKQFKMDEYFTTEYITTKYTVVQAVIQEREEGLSPVIVRQELNMDSSTPDVSRLRIGEDY